ncbi:hypothetical protein GCM10027299_38990 [Larkinella ripae]
MTPTEKTYQSILQKLSLIPVEYLVQVDELLAQFSPDRHHKEETRQTILNLAGCWNDMSEEDFEDFRKEAKKTGDDLFNRAVDL